MGTLQKERYTRYKMLALVMALQNSQLSKVDQVTNDCVPLQLY